jgi:hypothetical protein
MVAHFVGDTKAAINSEGFEAARRGALTEINDASNGAEAIVYLMQLLCDVNKKGRRRQVKRTADL